MRLSVFRFVLFWFVYHVMLIVVPAFGNIKQPLVTTSTTATTTLWWIFFTAPSLGLHFVRWSAMVKGYHQVNTIFKNNWPDRSRNSANMSKQDAQLSCIFALLLYMFSHWNHCQNALLSKTQDLSFFTTCWWGVGASRFAIGADFSSHSLVPWYIWMTQSHLGDGQP